MYTSMPYHKLCTYTIHPIPSHCTGSSIAGLSIIPHKSGVSVPHAYNCQYIIVFMAHLNICNFPLGFSHRHIPPLWCLGKTKHGLIRRSPQKYFQHCWNSSNHIHNKRTPRKLEAHCLREYSKIQWHLTLFRLSGRNGSAPARPPKIMPLDSWDRQDLTQSFCVSKCWVPNKNCLRILDLYTI